MRNKPFSSSSYATPCEWKSRVQTINNAEVSVYQPVQTTTPVVVTTPSLSVGNDPTFSVNKIKRTVAEILADTTHAPITCQALINSADTAVFASTNSNGYHLLPVSGKKIHEHLSSGNITEIKTSGSIEAGKNLDVTSHLGRARIGQGTYDTAAGTTGSLVTFSHHDCSGNDYALLQTDVGETMLNCKTGQRITFTNQGVEKMRVHSNGFVGINQVAPTVELEVGGDIKATNLTTTGSIESGSGDVMLRVMSGFQTNGNLVFGRADVTDETRSSAINVSNSYLNSANKMKFELHNGTARTTAMTLTGEGRVGIGTTNPNFTLDVNGSFKAHTVETNRLYASAYNLSAISPDVWALAGDTTAYEGGGNITKSSAVSIKNLNGIPFWFFGDNDSDVTINNAITHGNTWTIAIAITKKPESEGVIFAQLPTSETAHGSENNHRIGWGANINGDEYRPSGGGWNTGAYVSIPDESTLIVRRNGTGANSISVFLNGGLVYQTQYTEGYSGGTITKMRLGQINRYSNYQNQTPLYMGIAAVAAWSSSVSNNNIRKFVNYQSLTTKA